MTYIESAAQVPGRETEASQAKRLRKLRGEEVLWEEQLAAMSAAEDCGAPPARVLVCAQSNAAIDELLARVGRRGLLAGGGGRRPASIVRLGKV